MGLLDDVKNELKFLGGFKLTFQHLTRPRVTRQYPDEKKPKQPRQHGRHVLNRYEDGMEKCIGCELCAGVCPADCIYVRGLDNPPDHPVSPGERYGYVYEINYLRCIHCDLCVEACPTEAITESKLFEFSFTNRADAIYTKDELLVGDDGRPKHLPWEDWREGDDLHTSGWMRATSPSGSAAYEGEVQWSGELGYGVRPPEGGQSGRRDDDATGSQAPPRGAGGPPAGRGHPLRAPGHAGPAVAGPALGRAPQAAPRGGPGAPAGRPRRPAPWPSGRRRGDAGLVPGGRDRRHHPRRGHLRRQRGRDPGRRGRGGDVAQPGARRPVAGDDAVRGGRALRRAARRLPGRRAGHRLRRRHRRAVPLRDHVPRASTARRTSRPNRSGASGRWPSC